VSGHLGAINRLYQRMRRSQGVFAGYHGLMWTPLVGYRISHQIPGTEKEQNQARGETGTQHSGVPEEEHGNKSDVESAPQEQASEEQKSPAWPDPQVSEAEEQ
jgi:hypothetical protein